LAGDLEIAVSEHELVGLHHVDLERDARRPVTVEFGGRDSRVKSKAPLAPRRVCASICAGSTPSENPA
jgi:hypothetical protein